MPSEEENRRKLVVDEYMKDPTQSYAKIGKVLGLQRNTVRRIILRFKDINSTTRKPGSGKKSGPVDKKLSKNIVALLKRNPNVSERAVATKLQTSKTNVHNVKQRAGIKSYLVQNAPGREEKNVENARKRARKLYDDFLLKTKGCLVMDDESYIKADFRQLPGRNFYAATKRFAVDRKYRSKFLWKFLKKFLVWQAICSCGERSDSFVTTQSLISEIYIKECLTKRLMPLLTKHKNTPIQSHLFWPDLATCHYSKATMEWYASNGVQVVTRTANPPNCPELRPIERYWAITKGHLRRSQSIAKNHIHFKTLFDKSASKVSKEVVHSMMGEVKSKVRKFAKEGTI